MYFLTGNLGQDLAGFEQGRVCQIVRMYTSVVGDGEMLTLFCNQSGSP